MLRLSILIMAAAIAFAGYNMWDRKAVLQQQMAVLSQERQQLVLQNDELAGQLEDMQKQLRELRASHELYILVTEDMDRRLVSAEGRKQ